MKEIDVILNKVVRKLSNKVDIYYDKLIKETEYCTKLFGYTCFRIYDKGYSSNPTYCSIEELLEAIYDESPIIIQDLTNPYTGIIDLSYTMLDYYRKTKKLTEEETFLLDMLINLEYIYSAFEIYDVLKTEGLVYQLKVQRSQLRFLCNVDISHPAFLRVLKQNVKILDMDKRVYARLFGNVSDKIVRCKAPLKLVLSGSSLTKEYGLEDYYKEMQTIKIENKKKRKEIKSYSIHILSQVQDLYKRLIEESLDDIVFFDGLYFYTESEKDILPRQQYEVGVFCTDWLLNSYIGMVNNYKGFSGEFIPLKDIERLGYKCKGYPVYLYNPVNLIKMPYYHIVNVTDEKGVALISKVRDNSYDINYDNNVTCEDIYDYVNNIKKVGSYYINKVSKLVLMSMLRNKYRVVDTKDSKYKYTDDFDIMNLDVDNIFYYYKKFTKK